MRVRNLMIQVELDGSAVPVDRRVFESLFENSVASDRADVRKALVSGRIKFTTLLELSRLAEIPYPLFFSPAELVDAQLKAKRAKLMVGFTKKQFSVNSRSTVHLEDLELIVKDLLRKQRYLRTDPDLETNRVVGCLRKSRAPIAVDAATLMNELGLARGELPGASNKGAALELLIGKVEAGQILVAQSSRNYMPQQLPRRTRFSGMTVKDPKVPYIFLASGDEGDGVEPTGRRIFTLTLLTVLIARGTFAPVTYSGHSKEVSVPRDYEIASEILMPAAEIRGMNSKSMADVVALADHYKVTPSAVVMRARRLGLLSMDVANGYLDELKAEFSKAENPRRRSPKAVNALKKYNGVECSRRMLKLLDAGRITRTDFCRVMFSNKLRPPQIKDFRAAV